MCKLINDTNTWYTSQKGDERTLNRRPEVGSARSQLMIEIGVNNVVHLTGLDLRVILVLYINSVHT